ncbi:MAG: M14 family zinc carboxypeptidase [Caldilineaceae bacterium]
MYRTIAQLDAAIESLANTRPDLCTRLALHNSVEGRPIYALRLRAGGGTNRRGILIVGGMHARELMNPDAIIELAFDLAQAYTKETGLSYGSAEWSPLDIRIMLETLDIWMLPFANPALRKTFAFAFETGPDLGDMRESFQPSDPEPIKFDTKAGLVALIQQSVCAIEFIGETLQAGTVESIRAARDELLLPTEKGRGWIELVTIVQAELLGTVLSDKALTKQAISLLARVQKLAAKRNRATVSARDVEDGIAFLEALKSRATRPEVRKAISIVNRQLSKASGQTVAAILQELAWSNPPKS